MTIFHSQIRDSSNLEGQVTIFISPKNKVAHLYPQALGSLFVAYYDSQGYGRGIRTRLHAGMWGLHTHTHLYKCRCLAIAITCLQVLSSSGGFLCLLVLHLVLSLRSAHMYYVQEKTVFTLLLMLAPPGDLLQIHIF
jgi:hypothetical protein